MAPLSKWSPQFLSLLRIVAGFMFFWHGCAKLLHYPHLAMFEHVELMSLMGLAGVLEMFGGLLLFLGLFTRLVGFILSGEMAVAYFMAHFPGGFLPIVNGGELAALYSFVFLYFAAAGGGPWSIDAKMRKA